MNSLAEELQALEDILQAVQPAIANGTTAVLDAGAGIGILEDGVGTAEARSDSEMSEPTEEEKLTRQQQLAAASKEFDEAVALGVFNGEGEELYSDQNWRPETARTRSRPPTPPVPEAAQHFELATGDTTPRSLPDIIASSPDLTPKRQRL